MPEVKATGVVTINTGSSIGISTVSVPTVQVAGLGYNVGDTFNINAGTGLTINVVASSGSINKFSTNYYFGGSGKSIQ